ncbi:hypothetical protein FACS1894111_05700 [Clostridia bacterium]|nr:hypothetical protein FACS1894111_05700 [Clostridia bacterium]
MEDDKNNTNAIAEGAGNATEATTEGAGDMGKGFSVVENKNEAEGNKRGHGGTYVHKFRKPFEYEGKKYATLNFDFEKLTGRDMITIENEMQANNEYALDPLLSRNFQSKMAAKAGGIGSDVLESLPIQEFNKVVNEARNFLIDSGY